MDELQPIVPLDQDDVEVTLALPVMSANDAQGLVDGTVSMDAATSLKALYERAATRTAPVQESQSTQVSAPLRTPLALSPTELTKQDGIRRISNSEIQTFSDCRRKWWFAYYRGLQLRQREDHVGVASIGGRIHRAAELFYVPEGNTPIPLKEALERVIEYDWNQLVEQFDGLDGIPLEFSLALTKQNKLERAMIEGYAEWLEETGADAELEIIEPESYVEAPLIINPTAKTWIVKLIGRLDVRARRTTDGKVVFIDHKTVGEFKTPTATLRLNPQMLMYMVLAHASDTPERRTNTAIYNMMRRVLRSQKAVPPFYQRLEITHSSIEISSFRERLKGQIHDIVSVEEALAEGQNPLHVVYPRPSRDCTWKCPFFQVCGMVDDGSRLEDALKGLYETHDPYAYYQSTREQLGDSID